MTVLFFKSGSTTICPTLTRARSWSFKLEILTFVGARDPSTRARSCCFFLEMFTLQLQASWQPSYHATYDNAPRGKEPDFAIIVSSPETDEQ
eukprot:scaffold14199_cov118-Isochrysis_galbana.AAC.3